MNKVVLIGRPTKDIELSVTNAGKKYTNFVLAVNRRKKDESDFISCIAWENLAEVLSEYVHKGNRVCVIGHIATSSYEKNGARLYRTDVVIDEVEFIESKNSAENNSKRTGNSSKQDNRIDAIDISGISGDDLPF